MVTNGQVHTMSDVLVAVVCSMAAFSERKYSNPPVSPSAAMMSSSRHERLRSVSRVPFLRALTISRMRSMT